MSDLKKFRLITAKGDWTGIVRPEYLERLEKEGPMVYGDLSWISPSVFKVRLHLDGYVDPPGGIDVLSDDDWIECVQEDILSGDQCGVSISITQEVEVYVPDTFSPEYIEEKIRERLDEINESNTFDEPEFGAECLDPKFFTEEYLESLSNEQSWPRTLEFEVIR